MNSNVVLKITDCIGFTIFHIQNTTLNTQHKQMALSRIWASFIIVALLVSVIRFGFQHDQKNIFSQLVTGKNTDTISARNVDSAMLPVSVQQQFQSDKIAVWNKEKVVKTGSWL